MYESRKICDPYSPTLPGRIRVLRQWTAIREYLAVNAIKLVEHHKKPRRLDKLQIVREPIRTQKQIGKAPDVWIIFRQSRNAFLNEGREPRLVRQPAGQVHAHIDTFSRH